MILTFEAPIEMKKVLQFPEDWSVREFVYGFNTNGKHYRVYTQSATHLPHLLSRDFLPVGKYRSFAHGRGVEVVEVEK